MCKKENENSRAIRLTPILEKNINKEEIINRLSTNNNELESN